MTAWNSPPASTASAIEKWRQEASIPALRSSRMVLAICAAFAAPLCALLNRRAFAIHLYGSPADQRRCVLEIASSLYGGMGSIEQWRSAARNIRSLVTSAPHDGLLLLDGIGKLSSHELAETTAALWADGGDQRGMNARRDSITVSSGDVLIDQGRTRIVAGDDCRIWIFNVPVSAWSGNGVFESSGAIVDAEFLSRRAQATGGPVGVQWLRYLNYASHTLLPALTVEPDTTKTGSIDLFTQLHMNECIGCFDLLASAGEIATTQGLTGWPEGAATVLVERCRRAFESVNADRLQVLTGRFLE